MGQTIGGKLYFTNKNYKLLKILDITYFIESFLVYM